MKIGMFSFAHMHADGYAHGLRQLPDVELAGIYDADPARGQRMADRHGIRYFADAQALLDEGLAGAIICSENANHRPLVELAAGQTGYILCEKPIATTLADAKAMIAVCAATGTQLQIAFPVRFSPPVMRLRALLAEGVIVRPLSAKCTNHGSMPGGWFIDPALSGGGAVIDHTVHVIDLLRWIWDCEVTSVFAEVGDSLLHPELGCDDVGMLSFTLSNGVYGTLDTSWSRPPSGLKWGDVTIEVVGGKGVIQTDAFQQDLLVASNKRSAAKLAHWGSNGDLGLVADFVGAIRANRPVSITGHDGHQALAVALAAYEAARTGRVQKI